MCKYNVRRRHQHCPTDREPTALVEFVRRHWTAVSARGRVKWRSAHNALQTPWIRPATLKTWTRPMTRRGHRNHWPVSAVLERTIAQDMLPQALLLEAAALRDPDDPLHNVRRGTGDTGAPPFGEPSSSFRALGGTTPDSLCHGHRHAAASEKPTT